MCDFHNILEYRNHNHIPPKLRRTSSWSQPTGPGRDSTRKVPKEVLQYENGVSAIVAAANRRELLLFVPLVFADVAAVIYACHAANEYFKAFESRFEVAGSRFHSHGSQIIVPEPFLALMFYNSARVARNERVRILAEPLTSMPFEASDTFFLIADSNKDSVESSSSTTEVQHLSTLSPQTKSDWKPLSTSDYIKHVIYSPMNSVRCQYDGPHQFSSK